jgi:tRNA pseudouridine38-40 synthase
MMMTRMILLIVEYDGTAYSGWQVQPNGTGIQQVLEEALARMLGEPVRVTSSGRTDAGVHAAGMAACFRTEKQLPLKAFSDGLNTLLPPDIAVREAVEAPPGFNPRRDAISKHYRYTILSAPRRSPLMRSRAWHVREPLDLDAMRQAAARLVGEHDFAAFRAANCGARTTRRKLFSLTVQREGDLIFIDVHGSGFLKNMVRIIAGTLVEVGRGRRCADELSGMLASGNRNEAGMTAPPQGLCLMQVTYERPCSADTAP